MSTSNTTSIATSSANFEANLAELETIVAQMESGNLPLEQAMKAYTRGAALLQTCQQTLKEAEQQIQILNDAQQLTPFEANHE